MSKSMFVEDYVKYNVAEIIDGVIIVCDDNNIRHVGGKVVDRGYDKNGAMDIDFILDCVYTGSYFGKVIVHDPIRAGVRVVNDNTGEIIDNVSDKHYWYVWCKLSGLYRESRPKVLVKRDDRGYLHMKKVRGGI